jgi:hypothetical protein
MIREEGAHGDDEDEEVAGAGRIARHHHAVHTTVRTGTLIDRIERGIAQGLVTVQVSVKLLGDGLA